jgi:hypothetical protein
MQSIMYNKIKSIFILELYVYYVTDKYKNTQLCDAILHLLDSKIAINLNVSTLTIYLKQYRYRCYDLCLTTLDHQFVNWCDRRANWVLVKIVLICLYILYVYTSLTFLLNTNNLSWRIQCSSAVWSYPVCIGDRGIKVYIAMMTNTCSIHINLCYRLV